MEAQENTQNTEFYQRESAKTWTSKDRDTVVENLTHALFGLSTETGEVIDLFKKTWFTPNRIDNWDKVRLTDELGDVLYYLCRIADQYSITLDEIMEYNLTKLNKRYGDGDEAKVSDSPKAKGKASKTFVPSVSRNKRSG